MKKEADLIKSILMPSEIIAQKVSLKSKGNGQFVALCPFHQEKTPSFTVSDLKGFYHCFGCGAHGDIFTFIMETEKISYREALKKLASIAGVTLKDNFNQQQNHSDEIFYNIYQTAAKYFCANLFSKIGNKALNYIKSRSITDEVISKYQLGFAPANSNELTSLLKKDFSEESIVNSKILKGQKGNYYNPFYNRIIFPIHNLSGRVIGFGGRVIDDAMPKYLNSAENPIFHKSDNLYAYHIAKQQAYHEKEVLVVEGYMDVLALASKGVFNVVAPLGANINSSQIQKLWKLSPEPNICFDNDNAGKKATYKIAHEILEHISYDKTLKITMLEGGKDPDEILEKYGSNHFKDLVKKSYNLCDYLFKSELELIKPKTPEQQTRLKKRIEQITSRIKDNNLKNRYRSYLNNLFYETIYSKKIVKKSVNKYKFSIEDTSIIKQIFSIILNFPELLFDDEVYEEFFKIEFPLSLDTIGNIVLNLRSCSERSSVKENLKKILMNHTSEILMQFKKLQKDGQYHEADKAKEAVVRAFDIYSLNIVKEQIVDAEKQLYKNTTEENLVRLIALKEEEIQRKDRLKIV